MGQMLCITCDNASSNTVMVEALGGELPDYGGPSGHARCFLHTTNLVALKSLLRAFDVKRGNQLADVEMTVEELRLIRDMEEMADTVELDGNVRDDAVDDNLDGLVDENDQLSPEETQGTANISSTSAVSAGQSEYKYCSGLTFSNDHASSRSVNLHTKSSTL